MPWPPKILPALGLLCLLAVAPVQAAPPSSTPAPPLLGAGGANGAGGRSSSAPLPDYGGRDAPLMPSDAAGTALPNPLAQAGRALEALVIVLVGVVGVLYLLKRLGVTGTRQSPPELGAGGRSSLFPWGAKNTRLPATSVAGSPFSLNIVQSQALPGAGGATLHLLSVNDDTLLLLGATPQGITLLAQWDDDGEKETVEEAPAEKAAFDEYLRFAGIGSGPSPARAAGGAHRRDRRPPPVPARPQPRAHPGRKTRMKRFPGYAFPFSSFWACWRSPPGRTRRASAACPSPPSPAPNRRKAPARSPTPCKSCCC